MEPRTGEARQGEARLGEARQGEATAGRRGWLGLAAAGLTLAGCATGPGEPQPLRPAYPPPGAPFYAPPPPSLAERVASAFAWSAAPGANAIAGHVAYRTGPAESWTCAGQSVGLTPETPFSAEHMRAIYGSTQGAIEPVAAVRARSAADPGVDYSRYLRTTSCDARGQFAFRGLPDGAYYLITPIRRRGPRAEVSRVVMQRVVVRGGGVRELSLPERPPPG